MANLLISRRAQQDLIHLPASLQRAVAHALDDLAIEPRAGKPLRGRLEGLWSLRVGNYRVLYSIEGRQVVVRDIRHRAVAYPGKRR